MIMIDINMPDNCDECQFNTEYGFCKAMPDNFCGNTDGWKRPKWCPLKEQEGIIKTLEDKNTKLMLLINEYLKKEREAEAVVWCKDCKYCEYPEAEREMCKKGHIHRNAETWFCADGERRTDDV